MPRSRSRRLPARRDRRHLGDDAPRTSRAPLGRSVSSMPSAATIAATESGPAIAPEVGRPVRLDRVDQRVDLARDHGREALADGVEPERARERVTVAPMLLAVEREHARPDHLRGRETRVVDRVRLRVAHHLEDEVAPRHEPGVEHRHPRDRLALAQAREYGCGFRSSSASVTAAPTGRDARVMPPTIDSRRWRRR